MLLLAPVSGHHRRTAFAFACAAFLTFLVASCGGKYGFLGDCDDPDPTRRTVYTCNGDTLHAATFRSGDNGAHCEETTHDEACTGQAPQCLELGDAGGACKRACNEDVDCTGLGFCGERPANDGRRACTAYAYEHAPCGNTAVRCEPDLECVEVWTFLDGGRLRADGGDAGAAWPSSACERAH